MTSNNRSRARSKHPRRIREEFDRWSANQMWGDEGGYAPLSEVPHVAAIAWEAFRAGALFGRDAEAYYAALKGN